VATGLNNLASLYHNQGKYTEAVSLYKRSLAINEKALGPQHPSVALSLNNIASLYLSQGKYTDAEPLLKRSLAINEKALGPQHPLVAMSLNSLALTYRAQEKVKQALGFYRRASRIYQTRFERAPGRSAGPLSEQKSNRFIFTTHVRAAFAVARKEPSQRDWLVAESFSIGQLAQTTQAGAAVSRMAARFSEGNDIMAKTIRAHQDAVSLWQRLDADLIKLLGAPTAKRNPVRKKLLRKHLGAVENQISVLKKKLTEEFPDYVKLIAAKPVQISDAQKLLKNEEALVTYLVTKDKTYVWAVRQNQAEMFVTNAGQDVLQSAVNELRHGLDAKNVVQLSDLPPFNRTAAHRLYQQIFAPVEKVLEGARHVFVVADGALQSLPLGVLVTDEPQVKFKDFSGYRQVPWLAKKYALTTLPSVSSLQALRRFAKRPKTHIPFTGFGNPLLKGHPSTNPGVKLANLYRGAIANVEEVRNLNSLPHTAGELRALSAAVKGDSKHIYLQKAATEQRVKSLDLSNSSIVAFATHGLITGELKTTEPALVLTPPEKGTVLDDGLLTASEIAQLKLNANLVILSACNTAAGDGTAGAEGLSGLAKAFFYAGSKALLVSHWLVESGAAVKLTTGMLNYRVKNHTAGLAEALQQSMLSLMNTPGKPHYAHPSFWAPFVIVGEGGIQTAK
jgi:CHAT domain-containing protein